MAVNDTEAKIEVVNEGGATTIKCEGALDLHNYAKLHEALIESSNTAESISVDFVNTVYIDTAVLASLARAANKMIARGKSLNVTVADPSHPLRTLHITGFTTVLNLTVTPKADNET